MIKEKHHRRKSILSNPKEQMRIIIFFSILAIIYAAINYGMNIRALNTMANKILEIPQSLEMQHDVSVLLSHQTSILSLQLIIFTLLAILMLIMGVVLMSHRIGGPIYHITKYMREVSDGTVQPRPIKFRKGDFFHEMAETFNKFQEKQYPLNETTDEKIETEDATL